MIIEITITTSRKLVPQRGCRVVNCLRILNIDRLAGFEVEDDLVLGAVILKHPADVLQP